MAAAAGQSTAVATIATVTAAVQATWGSDKSKLSKDKLQNPTEWFVADDPMSRTRYFIIQGSDTLDHWKVNLTFDPVVFEEPSLGVKVGIAPALISLQDFTIKIRIAARALSVYNVLGIPNSCIEGMCLSAGQA